MSWQEIRSLYGRETVNLRNEQRWMFLNTLFSVSEAVMYMQLVDRLDQGAFSAATGSVSYLSLYSMVAKALYRTHVEGKLKAEIIKVGMIVVNPECQGLSSCQPAVAKVNPVASSSLTSSSIQSKSRVPVTAVASSSSLSSSNES
eukprot:gene25805-11480_t